VKSAYYLTMTRVTQQKGGSSKEVCDDMVWHSIWSLQAPPVVRHFCWKVCNNLLPTKSNLALKKLFLARNVLFASGIRRRWFIVYGVVQL
jgi:hypothetical protein